MKKVLIVANEKALQNATKRAVGTAGYEGIGANHEEALITFLSEEPNAVVIFDYSERGHGDFTKGRGTYRDIKNSADIGQKVVRLGFDSHTYPDYLKLPFLLTELFDLL